MKEFVINPRTKEEYELLLKELEKREYRWNNGHKITKYTEEYRGLDMLLCLYNYKNVTIWSIERAKEDCPDIHIMSVQEFIGDCIKPEFSGLFKRTFRINRIPPKLTQEQKIHAEKNNWLL